MSATTDFPYDYFISRRGSAAQTAQEVANSLEKEGYRVKIQDYDFGRGGDFVGDIHDALISTRHLIVLHTEDYDQNYWTRKEFTSFLATLPESQGARRICILRCDESMPRGILSNLVFGDLFSVSEPDKRHEIILATARGEALRARREPPIFGGSMPKKNSNFTGRQHLLGDIKNHLKSESGSTAINMIAICGLAGTGKTSLARACVDELAPEYAAVWWINGQSRQDIAAGLASLGIRLDPTMENEADVEKSVRAVLHRIERLERPLLLIFDNVENPNDMDDFLPTRGAHALVTSRRSEWHGRAYEISVGMMEEAEAVTFLQTRSGRKDEAGARALAQLLGCLPLALDHAGAYVRLSMSSFDAYSKSVDRLIGKVPKDAPYPASVAATFLLAIENAIRDCAAADIALSQLAFFAPDRIPLELLPESILNEDDRGEALIALSGVSLVRGDALDDSSPGITVHRLVQVAARLRSVSRGESNAALERAIKTVEATFPGGGFEDPATWPRCGQLLVHVLAVLAHAGQSKVPVSSMLYDRVGQYLHGRAMFPLAESMFRDAVSVGETTRGVDSLEVAHYKTNLANVLYAVGRRQEAEPLLRQALKTQELELGRDDVGSARTMTSLAWLLHEIGQHEESEQLIREAIASGERTLGRGHPDVSVRINNLALVLQRSDRKDEAEVLLREAVQMGEMNLGRDHPMVLTRLNNLGSLLQSMGQNAEAELLYREAIDAGIHSLGHDHPDLAVWRNNLANLFRDQGRHAEAEPLYREALDTCEKKLGTRHPLTARVQRNLAVLQLATLNSENALSNAKKAVVVHEELLGRAHPWTRDSAICYVESLKQLGRFNDANAALAHYALADIGNANR